MRWTLAAMTLASSMILVDQTAVPLAAPHAIDDLHASIGESQWLMTANILPLAALMVFGGRLGDLFGMRRVFLFGAVTFALAVGALVFALSQGATAGWGDPQVVIPLVLAVVLAPAFVLVERRAANR